MKKYLLKIQLVVLSVSLTCLKLYPQSVFEDSGISIYGVSNSSVAWADYNLDGYMDFVLLGYGLPGDKPVIYLNDAGTTFEPQAIEFPDARDGDITWGDFDNDNDPDILITGYISGGRITRIFRNDHPDNDFTEISSSGLVDASYGSAAWGDYNNDGFSDFLLTGSSTEGIISKIYTNTGNNTFIENYGIHLTGVMESSAAWGDYDNDGDQDILLTGATGFSPDDNPFSRIYRNNGDNSFTEMSAINLTDVFKGSADWIDYDNDGDLDVFLSGASTNTYPYETVSKLYRNDGSNIFTDLGNTMFTGFYKSSSAWGDYDNDGDPDLLICGQTGTMDASTKIYRNDGSGTFFDMTDVSLTGVSNGSVAWGDYDNDSRLDILLTGMDIDYTELSVIYHNLTPDTNIQPAIPSGLTAISESSSILFSWNQGTDDSTPPEGLSYNILIRTSSGDYDVVSPLASTTDGKKYIPNMGNAQKNTSFRLRNPKKTTYYWRVQAIDNGYVSGEFASEENITFSTSLQASEVFATDIQGSSLDLHWIRGNGTACAVFAKEGTSGTAVPVNLTSYGADASFGLGDEIGSTGWFCVYDGTGNMATVTGMKGLTNYIFQVIEYEAGPSYYTLTGQANPYVAETSVFTLQSGISLPDGESRAADWGDYDNDGDLDIQLGSTIYRNMGNNNFADQSGEIIFLGGGIRSWGDYDNDGDLDLLFANNGFIYSNNYPLNTFTIHNDIGLTIVSESSSQWSDFDNDGDLDIIIAGSSGSGIVTKIYRNNGSDSFIEQPGVNLPGISNGGLACSDYNKDGFIDILMTGNMISELFRNNGNFTFTKETGISLPGLEYSSCAWGDYNNDGFPDILLTGTADGSWRGAITNIYHNNGDNTFTALANLTLPAVYNGYGDWGDYDNDGDLDILLTGEILANMISKIYRNDGLDTFTEQPGINLTDVKYSCVSWGDFDKDQDLDILLCGEKTGYTNISQVYTNELISNNAKPEKPLGLDASTDAEGTTLSWDPVINDETPSAGLTYNIQVRTSGGIQIKPAMASALGVRKLAAPGNTYYSTFYKLKNLVPGQYLWSVQAVDNGFAGGTFSTESDFIVPEIQANTLEAKILPGNNTALTVKWKNGNGQRRIVFCKQGSSGTALPDMNEPYAADPMFSYGDQIGSSGWFSVYNGRSDSATVFGLTPGIAYSFHVIEYSGATGSETYFRTEGTANPGVFSSGLFSEQSDILLLDTYNGSATWGDYDNDNFLDILLTGNGFTKVYHNDGDNTFTLPLTIDLPGVNAGSSAWGDYDNDGRLDILLTGSSDLGIISKIFHNDGSDTFTDSGINLTGVFYGSAVWGDYDNDGFLDIILSGMNSSYGRTTELYHNEGGTAFTLKSDIILKQVDNSSSAWGDYDNDGDQDLLLAGSPAGEPYAGIYLNCDTTFTEQNALSLTGVMDCSVDWGDYDNDNDLDILMTGWANTGEVSFVYRNNGDNYFTLNTEIGLQGISMGSAIWGDYDNDGDLDILLTGGYFDETNYSVAKIYRNEGNGSFTEETGLTLPGVYGSDVAWGDYDNDGDLDILLTGNTGPGSAMSKIYRNNIIMKAGDFPENAKAAAPLNLKASPQPEGIKLSWSPVLNDETASETMTYNLRVGTASGKYDVCAPNSDLSSGLRRIAAIGNAQLDTTFLFKGLPSGKYYWSVQGVDQGYMGGNWSAEGSFEVKNVQAFFSSDEVCLGYPTHFTDQSVATKTIASWLWDFGDGATSNIQNPQHTYSTSGTFSVKLTITDSESATDFLIQNVTVKAKPSADFTAPAICQGTAATITNTTDKMGQTVSSWFWDFGDGQTSIVEQPAAHGYLGAADYIVQLKALASNGCRDSITKTVTVGAFPVAAVTANAPLTFCKGDSVTLTVPYNADYLYTWKGDGTSITGADSSRYVAKLTGSIVAEVTNSKGNCKTTSTAVSIVAQNAPAAPSITYSGNLTFCQGDSIILSVTNTTGYSYQWKLNGGAVGTNSYQYVAKASGNYSLTVTNTLGCSNNATNTVDVSVKTKPSLPTVNLSGPTTFCQGNYLDLSVTSSSGYTYQWENSGAAISGATLSKLTASNSGVYAIKITNTDNCFIRSENVTVNILTAPTVPTISAASATTFCQGDSVVLSVTNTPGYSYQWRLNGGSVGTNSNQLVAKISGSYDIVVSNSSGCSVSSVSPVAVVVNPMPVMSIITLKGDEKFCSGKSTNLSVPANTDYIYAWKKGTSDLGLSTNSIDVTESGDYTVEVSLAGCKLTAEPAGIEVVDKPAKPDIDQGSYSPNMCLGENPLRLSVDNIVPGYSYQWYKNETPVSTETFVDIVEAGNYYLEAVVDICPSERSSLSVTLAPAPLKPEIIAKGPTVWYLSTNSKAASYKWYFNGTPIPDATGSSYMAGQNFGIYRLATANERGCFSFSDTLRIPSFVTTGIEDTDPFADVKIYPNPTTGMFTIEMNNNVFGELVIDIITQNGSKILNIKFEKTTEHFSSQIDLSGQSKGMYLINLSLDKFRAVRKVLVE